MASRTLKFLITLTTVPLLLLAVGSQAEKEQNIVEKTCTGCHLPLKEGGLSRIAEQRKTPEGWEMTITRMQLNHQLKISHQQQDMGSVESKRALVKYLADHQGLAPSEAEPYRYLIEQNLNFSEPFESDTEQMCGRCHSSARVALQRRTEAEWTKLVHYHLGQFPSSEYSMYGRDRDWFKIAINDIVPELTKKYPLKTHAWKKWQAAPKPELTARWRVIGDMPGKGKFAGVMETTATEKDNYKLTFNGEFENGEVLAGAGSAIVYTGYEWRAQLKLDNDSYRQALAASADGKQLQGRMYLKTHEETGMQMQLTRDDGSSRLLSAIPGHIRTGASSTVTLHGSALDGDIKLPDGLRLVEVKTRDKDSITLTVAAAENARAGAADIQVGDATLADAITVYNHIDALQVTPAYNIARVGDSDAPRPKLAATFTAIGIDHGADGTANTDDDIEIGAVPASWSVAPFDAVAKHDRDVTFAGAMDAKTGVFAPAGAGPNPERHMSTNNAGNLKVIATVDQDGKQATGEGHLIVTVQRWNNPPLK